MRGRIRCEDDREGRKVRERKGERMRGRIRWEEDDREGRKVRERKGGLEKEDERVEGMIGREDEREGGHRKT